MQLFKVEKMTRITAAADKKNQAQPVYLRYCVHLKLFLFFLKLGFVFC